MKMCLDLVAELQDSIRKDQPSQWCKAIYNGPEHSLPFHWDADARLFVLPHAST
ncbi:hypothetical protein PTSG_12464 [Salpingoeca rosetta]|uniref:Uncharacterized protein n=1 Tax=Salpingoeca rosetta (strain ATCC 50818 / BSB-021) TaxID=946362 RepID=F2UFM2_SALR5|nr:uncharacterized protein PTSG_12464 [Salpingoeca rosetta]EGD75590.1 hypothetical protein PTSG_12464 [Salpingoeca rosetta]|eukprot:XP_004992047.1 hypothetical protein PTSG_12464 [Salpingoeca rosetta]